MFVSGLGRSRRLYSHFPAGAAATNGGSRSVFSIMARGPLVGGSGGRFLLVGPFAG
jgi:hypothetical protein